MTRPIEVVTVPVDRLREIISEAVAKALDDQRRHDAADGQALSAAGAAKLARTRRETVSLALESGALKGQRMTSGRWITTAAATRTWVEAGRPTVAR